MDLTTIRNSLATQITNLTGVRALAQAPDQVTPPCCVITPGNPFVTYADSFDGTLTISLSVMVVVGDASTSGQAQGNLDKLLGLGAGQSGSVPWAITQDPSLGGVVQWCEPVSVSQYGRITWANVDYWGARLQLNLGAV